MKVEPISERVYTNVMETLVIQEVEQQLAQLPPRLQSYVKAAEVETFALNRLPALYASSEKGWQCQYEIARKAHSSAIANAVRQGIAAVQIDPIRASQPLSVLQKEESEAILNTFRGLLGQPNLSWEEILTQCKRILLPWNHPERMATPNKRQPGT
ncbi:late competence development ComFB family protein [Romeria aff. gracilis LEGE 07310]|uniref:Late competence development ComFB family protein n=1 Tax=Vasconcelosia minhoensis LEGE 07310 TaxID=915328 RepID=A0A8J7A961_9CYAN|nr:late competence development ComFB family protein [Romeria gracilis]MBE9078385.1 late competence development ComFB family protein [Romeria aff. gracilis LEGE 07310]